MVDAKLFLVFVEFPYLLAYSSDGLIVLGLKVWHGGAMIRQCRTSMGISKQIYRTLTIMLKTRETNECCNKKHRSYQDEAYDCVRLIVDRFSGALGILSSSSPNCIWLAANQWQGSKHQTHSSFVSHCFRHLSVNTLQWCFVGWDNCVSKSVPSLDAQQQSV